MAADFVNNFKLPEVCEYRVRGILAFFEKFLSHFASIQPKTGNCSLHVKMKAYKFPSSTGLENLIRITESCTE